MLAQMSDAVVAKAPEAAEAEAAVARLREMSADLRGCVILGADGRVLAASGDPERWGAAGAELLAAADSARDEPVARVHVATADGEAFAVREGGLAMVAAANRFALASLMLFDMRAILRDLAATAAGNGTAPAGDAGAG
jgi:predicted regulator of Ras-like GTPase activity (Roadblock/LC7/MglB family)